MASHTSSNTEPGRWAKIVAGADSGRHPEIMIDDGKLVAFSNPSVANARIQSFLTDVFKDGDNEWFRPNPDSVEPALEKAACDGQPEGSKEKKISRQQRRANARQEKKGKGLVKARAELTKDGFASHEWTSMCTLVGTMRPTGVYREGGKIVATKNSIDDARSVLEGFLCYALAPDKNKYLHVVERGQGTSTRNW